MSDLLYHYGVGLFVTLNPCVLPILPFIILSALNVSRWGPVALSAGLVTAYVVVGGTLALVFAEAVEQISSEYVSKISAVLLIAFGILFVVPQFYAAFTGFLARFTSGAQTAANEVKGASLREQYIVGLLLALAWVPCSSPALIASGAYVSADVPPWFVYLRYFFFGLGAVTFILALGFGARGALMARRNAISAWVNRLKPFMGGLLILMGVLILTGGLYWIETQVTALGWGGLTQGADNFLQEVEQTLGDGSAAPRVPVVTF